MNPREEYRTLASELETLRALQTMTTEQTTRLREVMNRMRELEPIVRDLADADRLGRSAEELTRSTGRPSERGQGGAENPSGEENRGQGGAETQTAQAPERFSRRVLRSEALANFRQSRTPGQVAIESFYFHRSPAPEGSNDPEEYQALRPNLVPRDEYATITGSGLSTLVTPQRIPGISMATFVRPTVRDAFTNAPTTSNLVQFIREDVDANVNAAAAFDETDLSADNVKPESTIAFEEDEAPVRTVATTLPVTDAIIDDVPGFQNLLEGRLLDFLRDAEDEALLNGDGTTPELLGLLNTPGIQILDETYYDALSPLLPDVGEVGNEDINRLTHALTQIRQTGLAEPTYILLSPAGLDYFLMATDANRNYMAGNPFTTVGIPRFRGVPIIVTNKLDDQQAVVGDGRLAEVRDRMAARIDIGYVDKQFVKNQKTIRAEERLAFAVLRPAAHALVTLLLTP